MKKFRLLSFLCLLVIGWGSAWADEVTFAYSDNSDPSPTTVWASDFEVAKGNTVELIDGPITLALIAVDNAIQTKKTNGVNYLRILNNSQLTIYATDDANYTYKITKIEMYGRRIAGNFSNFTLDGNTYSWTGSSSSVSSTYTNSASSNAMEDVKYITVTYEKKTPTTMSFKGGGAAGAFEDGKIDVGVQSTGVFWLRIKQNNWTTPTTVVTTSDFTVSSTNGTALISNINGNQGITLAATPAKAGDVTITVNFLGKNEYAPCEWTFTVKAGTEITTLSPRDPARLNTIYSNATAFRMRINMSIDGKDANFVSSYFKNTLGANNANANFTLSSDNPDVITPSRVNTDVNSNNEYAANIELTAHSVGTANIIVKYADNTYYAEKSIPVTVIPCETSIAYSGDNYSINYSQIGSASGLPTITSQTMTGWIGSYNNNGDIAPTYTINYKSSDENVATVDAATGAVTLKNSGTTTITAYVVTTKDGLPYYEYSEASYTLRIQGSKHRKLFWFGEYRLGEGTTPGNTAGTTGKAFRGTPWIRQNLWSCYNLGTWDYENAKGADEKTINQNTISSMAGDIFIQALAFDIDQWIDDNPDKAQYFNKLKYPAANNDFDAESWNMSDNAGFGGQNVNQLDDKYFYKNDGTTLDKQMQCIQYSVDEPSVLDPSNVAKTTVNNGGVYQYQFWTYQGTENDSLTVIAYLPGVGEYEPERITTKVFLVKNPLSMSFEPREGFVTQGETISPYVNVPDISLNYVNKVLAWVEDENIAYVETLGNSDYEVVYDKDGNPHNAYIIYKDGDTDYDFVDVAYDPEEGIDKLWGIHPTIHGVTAGQKTVVHLIYNTDTFITTEEEFVINVLEGDEDDAPGFHWYINDDGTKLFSQHLGRSKATTLRDTENEEYNTIKFGNDDGEIKTIKIYEGDYIYMPGIVGNSNGNNEYSYCENDNNHGLTIPRYYMYSINNGHVVMNYDKYYQGEGVPNYFIANTCVENGLWSTGSKRYKRPEPTKEARRIPQDEDSKYTLDANGYYAYVFKAYITGRDKRGDTLMVYGAHPTPEGTYTYLYAEDPQTHKVCTPIRIQVLPKADLAATLVRNENGEWVTPSGFSSTRSAKQRALLDMSFPYTWDFQHMDMSLIEADVKENGASYWEIHREKPDDMYQANGFFNGDWDDKNYSEDLRQRWFKDMSANGEYLPQFKGLMLNIAGMDWWNQKYNRFNISKNGDYIYFEGGPHFLALPGFGIFDPEQGGYTSGAEPYTHSYPQGHKFEFSGDVSRSAQTGIGADDISLDGTIDGTRFHDDVPGTLHNHLNINYDGFLSANDFGFSRLPQSEEIGLMNTKVKLVINAYHNKTNLTEGVPDRDLPHISVGGKSMMPSGMSVNAINNDDQGVTVPSAYLYQRVDYCDKNTREQGHTYVFDINPYDPEYQDNIFIEFDHDVYVNWIAISTEPREMRSDFEVFTYAYPKDIDLDKTNLVMNAVTKAELGEGNEVEFTAKYASAYNSSKSELTARDVPAIDNSNLKKFAANEGVLIYPTKAIGSIVSSKGLELPTEKVTDKEEYANKLDYRATTGLVLQQEADKNVIRLKEISADGKYIYEDATYNHSYYFLPTYFIANAENVPNYDEHTWKYNYQKGDNEISFDEEVNRGKVPLINQDVDAIVATGDDNIPHNIKTNLLTQSTYKTMVYPDYYTTGNMGENVSATKLEGGQRWISLGLGNEYILRKLVDDDEYDYTHKVLDAYMTDEYGENTFNYESGQIQERDGQSNEAPYDVNGYSHSTGHYYFDLIGPRNVRFYRANNRGNMQCRRSYLQLTWEEYNVNTFGKDGVQNKDGGESEGQGWTPTNTETDKSEYDSDGNLITDKDGNPGSSGSGTGAQVGVKAYPVKIVFTSSNADDDILVSEDGGFPDGIKEIEQTSSASDGAFYNLNGIRVNTPRSGIYVVNGKKVVIK